MASFGMVLLYALVVTAVATPVVNANDLVSPQQPLILPSKSNYRCFDGTLKAADYPQSNDWLPFEALWTVNQPTILSRNGGDTYIEHHLREAIEQSSNKHKIDPRLVLAAVLQVSGGKVSAPCLGPSRVKCNQDFDASHPQASILRMVDEGLQIVAKADCWTAFADRFAPHEECADSAYLSDVANRLMGWDGDGKGFKDC